jgi:hypothetical protein
MIIGVQFTIYNILHQVALLMVGGFEYHQLYCVAEPLTIQVFPNTMLITGRSEEQTALVWRLRPMVMTMKTNSMARMPLTRHRLRHSDAWKLCRASGVPILVQGVSGERRRRSYFSIRSAPPIFGIPYTAH